MIERLRGLLRPRRLPAGSDQALFRRARLQLTAWYVLTLMLIVLAFSGVIYGILAARLAGHHHESHELASEREAERAATNFALGELRLYLLLGNAGLLVLGTAGAYLLAGRTLRPIADALARQRRFTADASHELRTPLTIMRGSIDVALARERTAADYRRTLEDVGEEVDGMTVLVEHLLLLARGAPHAASAAIAVREVLADLNRRFQLLARERGSTLQVDCPASAAVSMERAALFSALSNLVRNALEHTPPGTTVRVCATDDHHGVVLEVSDTGPGIPATERENVLRPFYRLATTGADGHGLGLALARELLLHAGGTLTLTETPGGGTTARLQLPRAAPAPTGSVTDGSGAIPRTSHPL